MSKAQRKLVESMREKEVPTLYSSVIKIEWVSQFTFWQRVKLLFGANLVILFGVPTEHRAGKWTVIPVTRISRQTTIDGHMQETLEAAFIEQKRNPKDPRHDVTEIPVSIARPKV